MVHELVYGHVLPLLLLLLLVLLLTVAELSSVALSLTGISYL